MENFQGQTFLLIGRSGSGKGVQGELLEKWLEGQGQFVLRLVTGNEARHLAEQDSVMGRWTKAVLDQGGVLPSWLPASLLISIIAERLIDPKQIILFDGSPRRVPEAQILDELMKDLSRPLPQAIYLEVSEEECRRRLIERARGDDKKLSAIESRLSWFKTETLPVFDYYGDRVIRISGQGTIEEIHANVIKKLGGN